MRIRLIHFAMGVGALAVAVGCSRTTVIASPFSPVTSTSLVYRDDGGGIQDSLRVVIQDEALWQEMWQRATSAQMSPPPRPAVDFEREMLLLVAAGRKRPGDQIQVDSVGVRNDIFYVFVGTTQGCGQIEADVYPLEIVRVNETERQVVFQETPPKRATGCP
jgi:hypothetical protein